MAISKISIQSFRNHKEKTFTFCRGVTVIWGENGSGKTAILEAIHILTIGKSFRTHQPKTLIRNEEKSCFIRGEFISENKKDIIATQFEKVGKKTTKINGQKIHSRKDILGRNNVVVMSPEEQSITNGGPSERRRFFDKVFSIVNEKYMVTLQNYNRVLKQRNALLCSIENKTLSQSGIDIWNEKLSIYGVQLWGLRKEMFIDFKKTLARVLEEYQTKTDLQISNEQKEIGVHDFLKELQKQEKRETQKRTTFFGPHRDNIDFLWDKKNLRILGSQGEHKVSLVLLKLAEMCFIEEKTKVYPLLLLDDLFAKLDLDRSKKIVNLLQKLETESGKPLQTVVTTTDIIDLEKSGMIEAKKEVLSYRLNRECSI